MALSYPGNLPARWGASKVSMMLGWWNGQSGAIMQRMIAQVFPGLPTEAHMGFVANGGWTEDTALARDHAPFHELGGYGISGGRWDIPAPNTDRSVENNWLEYHADSEVRSLLGGRDATMQPFARTASGRGFEIPLEDQIAIGLVSIKRKRDELNGRLNSRIRWQDPVGLWATALSFMAWSTGTGGAAQNVNRFANALAQVPEDQRWDEYLRQVAAAVRSGTLPSGSTHRYTVYSTLRTQQKIRASRALSDRLGRGTAFYGNPDPNVEDVIARAAARQPTVSDVLRAPEEDGSEHAIEETGWTGTEIALASVGVASVIAVGYIIYKRTTKRRPNRRRRY